MLPCALQSRSDFSSAYGWYSPCFALFLDTAICARVQETPMGQAVLGFGRGSEKIVALFFALLAGLSRSRSERHRAPSDGFAVPLSPCFRPNLRAACRPSEL
jgi:hypothetical protein